MTKPPEAGAYRPGECEKCRRCRVENDGVCEKCKWDNDGHNWASITRPEPPEAGAEPLSAEQWIENLPRNPLYKAGKLQYSAAIGLDDLAKLCEAYAITSDAYSERVKREHAERQLAEARAERDKLKALLNYDGERYESWLDVGQALIDLRKQLAEMREALRGFKRSSEEALNNTGI